MFPIFMVHWQDLPEFTAMFLCVALSGHTGSLPLAFRVPQYRREKGENPSDLWGLFVCIVLGSALCEHTYIHFM